jgi:hypothetical protein
MATPRRAVAALLAAVVLPISTLASAQAPAGAETNVTLYGGYRFGGELKDVTTDKTWQFTDGPAYSLAADFPLSRYTQWEIFVSHRSTALKANGFAPIANNIGLDVTYVHVGGTYFPHGVGQGFYGVGGLGATQLSPDQSGLNSATRFSLNLGAGYMIPIFEHVALKLEARGFVTILNSSGSMFCSGGCVVQVKGSTLTQGELMAGIAARF